MVRKEVNEKYCILMFWLIFLVCAFDFTFCKYDISLSVAIKYHVTRNKGNFNPVKYEEGF
jgi:hypothetical protein